MCRQSNSYSGTVLGFFWSATINTSPEAAAERQAASGAEEQVDGRRPALQLSPAVSLRWYGDERLVDAGRSDQSRVLSSALLNFRREHWFPGVPLRKATDHT